MSGFTPLGPYLVPEWQLTPLAFALLAAAYPLAAALALHTPAVTRRVGLVRTVGLLFVCLIAMTLASNPVVLCLARVVAGFIGGTLVATVAPTRSVSLAIVLSMPILLISAWLGSWRIALGIAAALAAAGAVLATRCTPPCPGTLAAPRARLPGALMAFAGAVMGTFMSGALVLNAGLSLAQLPLAFLAGAFLLALATQRGTFHLTAAPLPALARLLSAKTIALGILAALPLDNPVLALTGAGLFISTNTLRSVAIDRLLGPPEKLQHACLHLATGLGMLIAGVCVSLSPQGQLTGLPYAAFLAISALVMAWILVCRQSRCGVRSEITK